MSNNYSSSQYRSNHSGYPSQSQSQFDDLEGLEFADNENIDPDDENSQYHTQLKYQHQQPQTEDGKHRYMTRIIISLFIMRFINENMFNIFSFLIYLFMFYVMLASYTSGSTFNERDFAFSEIEHASQNTMTQNTEAGTEDK
jgi:hypothetical protein